jgi:hypothetical protein
MSLTRVKCDICHKHTLLVGNALLSRTKGNPQEYSTELRSGPYICKRCARLK